MAISDLSANKGNVNVEGVITEVGEVRSFDKYGKALRVANAILQDDSGSIKLTLWNDDTSRFKEGDRVKIENGYVGEFKGEKQLSSGKFGKIEKVGEGAVSKKKPVDSEEESLEEVEEVLEEGSEEEEI
jgi:replication factor A1